MDWIEKVNNNDNTILAIDFDNKDIIVFIELWNGEEKKLCFRNYMAIKEKQCLGEGIGDILISDKSNLLAEIEEDILKGDGSLNETSEIKSFIFMNAWNEISILEILAESVDFE